LTKLAEVVQGYWQKIGVKTDIVATDFATFSTLRGATMKHKGGMKPVPELVGEAAMSRQQSDEFTVNNLTAGFHSTLGNRGMVGFAFPELDKLLEDATAEIDATKRADMIAKATKIAIDSYTIIQLGTSPNPVAAGPKIDFPISKATKRIGLAVENANHKAS
jgi:ABC-type transport system substrate-binding protein